MTRSTLAIRFENFEKNDFIENARSLNVELKTAIICARISDCKFWNKFTNISKILILNYQNLNLELLGQNIDISNWKVNIPIQGARDRAAVDIFYGLKNYVFEKGSTINIKTIRVCFPRACIRKGRKQIYGRMAIEFCCLGCKMPTWLFDSWESAGFSGLVEHLFPSVTVSNRIGKTALAMAVLLLWAKKEGAYHWGILWRLNEQQKAYLRLKDYYAELPKPPPVPAPIPRLQRWRLRFQRCHRLRALLVRRQTHGPSKLKKPRQCWETMQRAMTTSPIV